LSLFNLIRCIISMDFGNDFEIEWHWKRVQCVLVVCAHISSLSLSGLLSLCCRRRYPWDSRIIVDHRRYICDDVTAVVIASDLQTYEVNTNDRHFLFFRDYVSPLVITETAIY
jgi:hypothetical protein